MGITINTHNSQIKIRKTKIKYKSQNAFNDTQQGFSYDDIIKQKIMYHRFIMSWIHGMHEETKPTTTKKQTREREIKNE